MPVVVKSSNEASYSDVISFAIAAIASVAIFALFFTPCAAPSGIHFEALMNAFEGDACLLYTYEYQSRIIGVNETVKKYTFQKITFLFIFFLALYPRK